jgi:hypothetical protein
VRGGIGIGQNTKGFSNIPVKEGGSRYFIKYNESTNYLSETPHYNTSENKDYIYEEGGDIKYHSL